MSEEKMVSSYRHSGKIALGTYCKQQICFGTLLFRLC